MIGGTALRVTHVVVVVMAFTLSGCMRSVGPQVFVSDGCSHFPEGTHEHKDLWLRCCLEHDKHYWQGGTRDQRRAADLALRECVRQVGEPVIAEIMLRAVRVGGSPYWPMRFRWAYGWPYPRGYRVLSQEEQEMIQKMLESYGLSQGRKGNEKGTEENR